MNRTLDEFERQGLGPATRTCQQSGVMVRNYAVPFIVAGLSGLSVRRVPGEATPWPGYLARYHADRPGITELLLAHAVDRHGEQPYRWLVEALRTTPGRILDLACGSAPTAALLPGRRWLGVDASAAELAAAAVLGRCPLVRGRADQLPLGANSVDGVCAAMCLQVLTPLDTTLDELRRVLRPGGVLVALVPSRMGPSRGVLAWWRVMRALGVRASAWPNPQARDGLADVLRAHGFTVDASERRVFWREVRDPEAARLVVDGLYLPDIAPSRVAARPTDAGGLGPPGPQVAVPVATRRCPPARQPGGETLMPYLPSLPEDSALVDVFRAYPDTAEPLLDYHQVLLRGPSPLTVAERELIAAYVSALNSCAYCHGVHAATAEVFGITEATLVALLSNLDTAPVAKRMKPILRYVRKLTLSPSRMTEADAEAVYAAGWDERALHDAVSVCALFNFMNRLVEGLGIRAAPGYFTVAARRLADGGYDGLKKLIGEPR
jgi:uncharacterized peroxidase-related enzyme